MPLLYGQKYWNQCQQLAFFHFCPYISDMKTRMGRPPRSGNKAMAGRLEIRVSAAEKRTYEEAARAAGMERSDWIRDTLNAAAKRALREKRSG